MKKLSLIGLLKENVASDFILALKKLSASNPKGSLLSVRDLRKMIPMDKEEFDKIAISLAKQGIVGLHYHDHPYGMSDEERNELIRDEKDNHYVGITLRKEPPTLPQKQERPGLTPGEQGIINALSQGQKTLPELYEMFGMGKMTVDKFKKVIQGLSKKGIILTSQENGETVLRLK